MKTIVVIDRNPHIRRLVQRELVSEGYTVYAPESELELMDLFKSGPHMDLMIIDPVVLDNRFCQVSKQICQCFPDIPVIVHSLPADKDEPLPFKSILGRIEKNWDSIGELKRVMSGLNSLEIH
jgi:CheY-like chemotaxis protein